MAGLLRTVHVRNPETGETVVVGPNTPAGEIPAWVRKQVTNPKVWDGAADDDEAAPDGAVTDADDTTPTQPEAGADQDRPEGAAEPGEPDGAVDDNAADEAKKPAGNATEDAWREYALANGKSEDDLKGLGRNEIRDLFA